MAAKQKRKSSKRDPKWRQPITVTFGAEERLSLDFLQQAADSNASEVLRALMPASMEVAALVGYYTAESKRNKIPLDSSLAQFLLQSFRRSYLQMVVDLMARDQEYPITVQCNYLMQPMHTAYQSILMLFRDFAKAKVGEPGYRFMHLDIMTAVPESKPDGTIEWHPVDSPTWVVLNPSQDDFWAMKRLRLDLSEYLIGQMLRDKPPNWSAEALRVMREWTEKDLLLWEKEQRFPQEAMEDIQANLARRRAEREARAQQATSNQSPAGTEKGRSAAK